MVRPSVSLLSPGYKQIRCRSCLLPSPFLPGLCISLRLVAHQFGPHMVRSRQCQSDERSLLPVDREELVDILQMAQPLTLSSYPLFEPMSSYASTLSL